MKKNSAFRLIAMFLLTLVFLFVCNITKVRADQTIQIGQSYGLTQAQQSTLNGLFSAPFPGEYTLHVTGWLSTYNWGADFDRVYVYNEEGNPIGRNEFSTLTDPFLFHMIQNNKGLTFRVGKAGTYTIKMHSGQKVEYDWGTSVSQNYTMSLTAIYSSDPNEPNESLATATALSLDTLITAYQWRQVNTAEINGDEDWYRVDLPTPGKLRLELAHWAGVYNWGDDYDRLYVYNAAGTSIGSTDGFNFFAWMMGGGTDSLPYLLQMNFTHAGTYYLRFHAGSGVNVEPYHFKTSFVKAYDPFEPNDSIPDAKPIVSSDVWYQAYEWRTADNSMTINGDEDFYSFETPAAGSYTFQLKGWLGIYDWGADYDRLWVLDAKGNVVGANPLNWMMGTAPVSFTVPAAGKYYLKLHCGGASSIGGYQFKLTGNILGGIDQTASKSLINVFPNPATDYIRLQLPTDGTALIRIYAVDGMLIRSETVSTMDSKLNVSDLKTGVYVLECRMGNQWQRTKLMIQRP